MGADLLDRPRPVTPGPPSGPDATGPAPAAAPGRFRRRLRLAGRYLLLAVVAVVVLTPIYVTVVSAIQPGENLLNYPRALVPTELTTSVLAQAWNVGNLGRALFNSAVVAVVITTAQVFTSILAAYAFAFLRFPARGLLFMVFLATLMVPPEATILVNRQTIQQLGWLDTYAGLVAPFLAAAFGTFLLRQVFLSLPRDLRDAAAMDGLGHWGFLWRVAVPLARPAIGAFAVFAFLLAWNQYLWPLLAIPDNPQMFTVQIALRQLRAANLQEINLVMAGTVIAAVPIAVLLLVFQRQLIRGLTAGAVKG